MDENRTSGDTNALTKTLARGTGINLAGFVARVPFVFLHRLLPACLFGAGAYGVYAIGVAAVSPLSIIGQFGLGLTTTRFVALHYANDEPGHIVGTFKLVLSLLIRVAKCYSSPLFRLDTIKDISIAAGELYVLVYGCSTNYKWNLPHRLVS